MKLFSWNVQGRVGDSLQRQIGCVRSRDPDVIALQEVTGMSLPVWQDELLSAGYSVLSSIDLLTAPYPAPPYETPPFPKPRRPVQDPIRRRFFNLVAARYPLTRIDGLSYDDPDEARFAFPEKHLAAAIRIDGTIVELHNTHLPPGVTRGLIKVHAFDAIRRRMSAAKGPKILCGDFNAPEDENEEGPLHSHGAGWPKDIVERWRVAEQALFSMPDMRDVYRPFHKPGTQMPVSHETGRGERLTPHRYDFIFASAEFHTESCEYLSTWLKRDHDGWRPSDHAPVEALLRAAGNATVM